MMIILGLTLILAACSQPPSPQITATPTIDSAHLTAFARPYPTDTPLPPTTPTSTPPPLGAVPQDCPPGPTPQPISPYIGPAIGSSPVWAVGFGGPHAVLHIPVSYDTYIPQYGWTWKLIWEVGPNYTHRITLRGGDLRNSTSLWFQFSGDPTTSPILDAQTPDHPESVIGNNWAEWGSYLYIPAAGCYYLEASWPGGHWRITFAAGR